MPPLADLEYLVATSTATNAWADSWTISPSVLAVELPLSPSSATDEEDLTLEDRNDLEAALDALKDPRRIPWEQVKRRLGL